MTALDAPLVMPVDRRALLEDLAAPLRAELATLDAELEELDRASTLPPPGALARWRGDVRRNPALATKWTRLREAAGWEASGLEAQRQGCTSAAIASDFRHARDLLAEIPDGSPAAPGPSTRARPLPTSWLQRNAAGAARYLP